MSDPQPETSPITSYSKWVTIIKNMVFHTKGEGASSTKGAYVIAAITIAICLFILTFSFCWVYLRWHKADAVFAGALATMTISFIGFASRSQNVKTRATIQGTSNDPPQPIDQ